MGGSIIPSPPRSPARTRRRELHRVRPPVTRGPIAQRAASAARVRQRRQCQCTNVLPDQVRRDVADGERCRSACARRQRLVRPCGCRYLRWDDATSGIASCAGATKYAGPDSTGVTLKGSCVDQAGNADTRLVPAEVRRDRAEPQGNSCRAGGPSGDAHLEAAPDTKKVEVVRCLDAAGRDRRRSTAATIAVPRLGPQAGRCLPLHADEP